MTSLIFAAAMAATSHTPGWACEGHCTHDATPAPEAASALVTSSQAGGSATRSSMKKPIRVFIYSRTEGFRHDSIEKAVGVFFDIADQEGLKVTWTEDKSLIKESVINDHDVVMFLNTTGDCVNDPGQTVIENFVEKRGGGFVGVHAAADTEYDWNWYGRLVGGYFKSHPHIQEARINVIDRTHPATKHLQSTWTRKDEWYDFRALPAPTVKILMKLDTTSYTGHQMGENHPIAWCHTVGKGRAIYTGGGHTRESYDEPDFRKHLLGAIRWAAKREEG